MAQYPPDHDLRQLLRFALDEGSIWLGSRRMVLVHAESLAFLRQALLQQLGADATRHLLLQTGFASGVRDAQFAQQLRKGQSLDDIFLVGPQLHMIEGAAQVRPVQQEMNVATGHFAGEFDWYNSWEAYAHHRSAGHSDTPVCWLLLGYASGYTSGFMGRLVLFEETSCAASGAAHCHIEGKSAHLWPTDAAVHQLYDTPRLQQLLDEAGTVNTSTPATLLQKGSLRHRATVSGARLEDTPVSAYERSMLQRAAAVQVPIWLMGEFGTGKQTLARQLHQGIAEGAGPFITLDCEGIAPDELEALLFGQERHIAPTTTDAAAYVLAAPAERSGALDQADGGTLYLENIQHLPPALQTRLLLYLREGRFQRRYGTQWLMSGARLIVTSPGLLDDLVQQGQFRRELLLQLQVACATLKPLRERLPQLPAIAQSLLQRLAKKYTISPPQLSEHALQTLLHQPWQGNLAELSRLLERAVLMAGGQPVIDTRHIYPALPEQPHTALTRHGHLSAHEVRKMPADICQQILASGVALPDLESQLLEFAVQQARGNLSAAARQLGVTRAQLAYRLQRDNDRPSPSTKRHRPGPDPS